MIEEYYTFLLPEFFNKCEFRDTITGVIVDPNFYINLNKRYRVLFWNTDRDCPYYDNNIPYYMSAPIIEAENNKLITVTYMLEDFYDDIETTIIHDEYGMCELEDIEIEKNTDWYKFESIEFQKTEIIK
jgi:hypothetical protein